jgi:hypothetical protein
MECLRDDPAQRAGEDADGSGDAKTGEGILLPDEIVRSLMRAPGINSIDLLQHASEELRGDREVVLAAVQQNGGALRYASEELRGDREFMLAA